MSILFSYRGRAITSQDVDCIRKIIAAHPQEHRSGLSRRLCKAWGWRQRNGELKAMICRGLLLRLYREGHITLPPPQKCDHNPFVSRRKPAPVEVDTTPIRAAVKDLAPRIVLKQVRRTPLEKVFNSLIEQYHYMGYAQPVGEHLKYIAFADTRPIGCLAFSSAAFGLKV